VYVVPEINQHWTAVHPINYMIDILST